MCAVPQLIYTSCKFRSLFGFVSFEFTVIALDGEVFLHACIIQTQQSQIATSQCGARSVFIFCLCADQMQHNISFFACMGKRTMVQCMCVATRN